MNRLLLFIFSVSSLAAGAQKPAYTRQMALNNYVSYANQSALEVTTVYKKVLGYYPRMKYFQKGKSYRPGFDCQSTPDEYYYTKAIAESNVLTNALALNQKINALHLAGGVIDSKCKALDTYHKLEDYKKDNFAQAELIIDEIQEALVDYRVKQKVLATELESEFQKMSSSAPASSYQTADRMMKKELLREQAFLDRWSYNLNEDIHTGWPVDELQNSIEQTDQAANLFSRTKLVIEYPASTMKGSFTEGLQAVLGVKRSALDGNNFEAKQSDKHSNEVYLDLINYYNGQLVADHNTFVNFAAANGYFGLDCINYIPLFEIRSVIQEENFSVVPFQDIAYTPVVPGVQSAPISSTTASTLGQYIDFINESVRQVNNLMQVVNNYMVDAAYYKDLASYKGKGGLSYRHENYKIPFSLCQTALSGTTPGSPAWRRSVNDQATVMISILKELDQLSVALEQDAAKRNYEKDNLKKAFEILERNAALLEVLDSKKERLYRDIRNVAESFPISLKGGSWAKSNKALLALVDEDRVQLAAAKIFIVAHGTAIPSTAVIDQLVRDVISNEFSNMKGIENLGSSNGNDPYTPYERIPSLSRTYSDKLRMIGHDEAEESRERYSDFIYMYNEVAENYNKFCELANIPILKTIKQLDYFSVRHPDKNKKKAENTFPEIKSSAPVPSEKTATLPVDDGAAQPIYSRGRVIHDTIKVTDIIRIETRRQDTVYIEKHDTIYRDKPGDRLLSLEGYATNNLVFLLDVSGSMNTGQKLPLLKKSMLLLLKILREEDHVSIVVYSGKARTVLPPTSAREQDQIKKAIENLKSGGDTDGNAGIKLAYKTADGNYIRAGNNRIILATDGEFKVAPETITLISKYANQDIFLSVFNFGQSADAATTLQRLSVAGKGNYESITRQNSDIKLIGEAKGKKK